MLNKKGFQDRRSPFFYAKNPHEINVFLICGFLFFMNKIFIYNLFLLAPESLHDTALIQSPGDFCEAYFGVIFQCLPSCIAATDKNPLTISVG